jgi:hypothetical protein
MLDSPVELIQATVQVEQPLPTGDRTVGTGFLIAATGPDGAPETVLVTANHVLADMPGQEARIGFRSLDGGTWTYTPQHVRIRTSGGEPLWTHHPSRDVAAMRIKAPEAFARAAIPARYLARGDGPSLTPGDELMVLGFPRGLAANTAGFPILRSGRVASYPLDPAAFPTFLLDFTVFPGNSGGPVFSPSRLEMRTGSAPKLSPPYIAGLLTQQVKVGDERLEIGVVTHARYVVETLSLLEGGRTAIAPETGAKPAIEGTPVSQAPRLGVFLARCAEWFRQTLDQAAQAFAALSRGLGLVG